jgi:SHAQKYF class myb-like DNA-binding protein
MLKLQKTSLKDFIVPIEKKKKKYIRPMPSKLIRKSIKSAKRLHKSRSKEKTIKVQHYSNGKWTELEHNMLLFALESLGNHWKAIQLFLGTRSCDQIRSHVQKHFNAIKRDAIRQMKMQNGQGKQLFMVTKQYMNFPFRCLLTEEGVKEVEDLKRKFFLSQRSKELKENEDFDLPPLGNLPHEDNHREYMREIEKIDFVAKPAVIPQIDEMEPEELDIQKEFDVDFNMENLNQPVNAYWQLHNVHQENHFDE